MLTVEAIEAYRNVITLLSGNLEALQAFLAFSKGYLSFHTLDRYRLSELYILEALNPYIPA